MASSAEKCDPRLHSTRRASRLPRVTVPAVECPYRDCRERMQPRIQKTRNNGDGSVDRYVACRVCRRHFVLTVDPSIPSAGTVHQGPP